MPDQAIADQDYQKWQPLAESTRQALGLLGYGVPECLPGEPEACGGNFAEHAVAHLAALRAVVDHRISHLGADAQQGVAQIYTETLNRLVAEDSCSDHPTLVILRHTCEHQASHFMPCRTCGA